MPDKHRLSNISLFMALIVIVLALGLLEDELPW
jgi:hypothetical protein